MLRELGIGADGSSVVSPLVGFNLGVELGQVAIAAVVLPIIWKLREVFSRRWIPATSVIVVALGTYWLIERTVL